MRPSRRVGHANGNGQRPRQRQWPATAMATPSLDEIVEAFTRDVEVTRRLYRSGESEYLIDGEVCRLRDVHELLMDTGLGAKAYAIIEQGKIGMILSSRPDRSASADRRSRGHHQVQVAPPRRGAEARGGAAEPHAHRRHRLRGREAARRAEAAGGEGAALQAAARRAAALGEGAVRAPLSRAGAEHRVGAGAPGRRARARDGGGRAPGRSRSRPEPPAHRAGRGGSARGVGVREDAHARELDINRRQQQLEFDRQQAAIARDARDGDRGRESRPRGAPRAGAHRARGAPSRRAPRPSGRATRPPPCSPTATEAHARAQQQIEALESRRRRGARREVYAVLNSLTALRHALRTRRGAARARGRDARRSSTSKQRRSAVETCRRSTRERAAARRGAGRAHEALDAVQLAARGARVGAGQRPQRARVARARRAHARAGTRRRSKRAWRSLEELDAHARRVRRRGAHGARPGQRPRRPAGRGCRLPRSRQPRTSAPSRRASAICCST